MGCFLGCFGSSKDRKRRKLRYKVIPRDQVDFASVFLFNARDRSAFVVPVLNPVENLTQWKALKSKGTPPVKPFNFNQQKENSSLNSTPFAPQNRNQETAVDASLSNWLVSSEKNTPNNKRVVSNNPEYEPISSGKSLSRGSAIEDRPILGALTEEELKQFSASSCTPRKSPSRNPDEMAIIGSVGSYWSHTDSRRSLKVASQVKKKVATAMVKADE
ncbi:hypothetical protein Ccrd_003656 [Cynara cardunculus var. scolymus]|uniref:Uncharacterized protein n=1 Tax=Cynara cardunculus var. scolymus TaxID=59895 RepID=A0A103XP63_CYNCS|nr:hypothetical protein Ccrd_003656 [Cynara cardunculus var. scolymus]